MARLQFTNLVSDVRGTLGGTVFKSGPTGPVAYSRPPARRRRQQNQTLRTATFSQLSHRWDRTLTPVQRDRWDAFASGLELSSTTRRSITRTGLQTYLSENLARATVGIAYLDDAPDVPRILPTPNPVVDLFFETWIRYQVIGDLPGAGQWFGVHLTMPFPATRSTTWDWFRQHELLTGPLGAQQNIPVDWPRKIGGTYGIYTVLFENTGLHSEPHIAVDVL